MLNLMAVLRNRSEFPTHALKKVTDIHEYCDHVAVGEDSFRVNIHTLLHNYIYLTKDVMHIYGDPPYFSRFS